MSDPLTGETRRFQGDQVFGCGVTFQHDLSGGKYSYGFDHSCRSERGSIFRVREVRKQLIEPLVSIYGQWKPDSRTTVRVDLFNVTDQAFGYDRDIHVGPRNVSPVQFTEVRRVKASPSLILQVRSTF